jgi:hypothetical protein
VKLLGWASALLIGALIIGGFNGLSLVVVILVATALGATVRNAS